MFYKRLCFSCNEQLILLTKEQALNLTIYLTLLQLIEHQKQKKIQQATSSCNFKIFNIKLKMK